MRFLTISYPFPQSEKIKQSSHRFRDVTPCKSLPLTTFSNFSNGLSRIVSKGKDEFSNWSQQNFFIVLQKYQFWPTPATEVQIQSRFSQSRGKNLEKPGRTLLKTLCETRRFLFLLACEFCKSTSLQNPWFWVVVFQRCVRLCFVTLVFFILLLTYFELTVVRLFFWLLFVDW